MSKVGLIFRKELMNALRDRRVLFSTVVIPLLVLPVVTMLPMMMLGKKEHEAQEKLSTVARTGLKFDELDRALHASGRFRLVWGDSAAEAIRQGKLDVALEVLNLPAGHEAARVRVLFSATRMESRAASDKVKLVLADLSRAIVSRQVDTTKINLNPVQPAPVNVASEQEMAGFFLGLIIGMMAIIGLITGGMVMAIDSTAGEKERKTLEVLLAAPVARDEIVLGKFLATLLAGMVSVALMTTGYAGSFVIGLRSLGPSSGISTNLVITPQVSLLILLVMLGVAGFIAALEMAVGIFARSYREAQTYLTPLTIVAVIPVVFMQTIPPNPNAALFFIPLLNAMLLIRELLMGSVASQHILNTLISCAVFALLALRLACAMFRRESALLR
jgi:sodium transport system permease protein